MFAPVIRTDKGKILPLNSITIVLGWCPSWLIRLKILGFKSNGDLCLSLPTEFLKDWVVNNYNKKIEKLCKQYFENVKKVKILVNKADDFKSLQSLQVQDDFSADSSSPLDPRFTFKNFVVGKSNEFAFAAARRVSENNLVSHNNQI